MRLCQKCLQGKITWNQGTPYLADTKFAQVHSSPSKKRKCSDCGEKVNHFVTDQHWSLKV